MKPIEIIGEILGSPIKVRILRHLAQGYEGQTGRRLATIARVSQPAVLQPLDDLVAQGILDKKVVGKSHLFTLNRKNIFVEQGLLPLFQLEKNLSSKLGEIIQTVFPTQIVSAVFFGSVARGEAEAQSDWDILLLCPDKKAEQSVLQQLTDHVQNWSIKFSSPMDVKIMTVQKFREKFLSKDPLVHNIYDDYITSKCTNPIFGESLIEILGRTNDQKDSHKKSS